MKIFSPQSQTVSDNHKSRSQEEHIVILGGKALCGDIEVSGSKNSSLAILAASLLASRGECVLHNVPDISDVETMCDMLRALGARVERGPNSVTVNAETLSTHIAPDHLVRKMRASFYVAAPLLARLRKAEVPLPGGCVLGARPINYHVEAFQKMGAQISVEHGAMLAEAPVWRGATIYLEPKNSSVGATVNIMMASCLANGTTTIENAAREPEVSDLAALLNKMGGKVSGAGTATIVIEGVSELTGAEHTVDFDRIEAGTYLAAAGLTRGDITTRGLSPHCLPIYLDKLQEAGLDVTSGADWIRAIYTRPLRATDIVTAPFPGYATDLQPPFVTMMCVAEGRSAVQENLYDGRFNCVPELVRMGASISLIDNTAIVNGVPHLSGAEVQASDLRAGAALVLAGLGAHGTTEVTNVHWIDRGYQKFEDKLRALGAQIVRRNAPIEQDRVLDLPAMQAAS